MELISQHHSLTAMVIRSTNDDIIDKYSDTHLIVIVHSWWCADRQEPVDRFPSRTTIHESDRITTDLWCHDFSAFIDSLLGYVQMDDGQCAGKTSLSPVDLWMDWAIVFESIYVLAHSTPARYRAPFSSCLQWKMIWKYPWIYLLLGMILHYLFLLYTIRFIQSFSSSFAQSLFYRWIFFKLWFEVSLRWYQVIKLRIIWKM